MPIGRTKNASQMAGATKYTAPRIKATDKTQPKQSIPSAKKVNPTFFRTGAAKTSTA